MDREVSKLHILDQTYVGSYLVRTPQPITHQIEINER